MNDGQLLERIILDPKPKLRWYQFSWTLLMAVALCALVLSLWKLGGGASVGIALMTGFVLGLPIALLGEGIVAILSVLLVGVFVSLTLGPAFAGLVLGGYIAFLGKKKMFILSAAVAGAVLTMILGFCFVDINVEALNASSPLGKTPYEVKLVWWWPIPGALLGAILAALLPWVTTHFPLRGGCHSTPER